MPSSKSVSVACLALLVNLLAASSTAVAEMDRAIYIAPVPNNPLTAVSRLNQTRIRADGSKTSIAVEETIARDGHGGMYHDRWFWDPATNKTTALIVVELFDPTNSTYTIMYPGSKTYWVENSVAKPEFRVTAFSTIRTTTAPRKVNSITAKTWASRRCKACRYITCKRPTRSKAAHLKSS